MIRLMNRLQTYIEKMLALLSLAHTIGLLIGEELRHRLYGELIRENEIVSEKERIPGLSQRKKGTKWKRYSGWFLLLKPKGSLAAREWQEIVGIALASSIAMVHPLIPTHV